MSQAPANASPPNNTLYLLLGLAGGLCLVCGGFAMVILVSVTGLSALAVSPKPPPTLSGGEGPPMTEPERAASARGTAQAFLDDVKKGNYEDAFRRTGGLYRSQSTDDLKAYIRGYGAFQRPTKVTIEKATRAGDVVTFKGSAESKLGKGVFTVDLGLENGEWRVLEFKIAE